MPTISISKRFLISEFNGTLPKLLQQYANTTINEAYDSIPINLPRNMIDVIKLNCKELQLSDLVSQIIIRFVKRLQYNKLDFTVCSGFSALVRLAIIDWRLNSYDVIELADVSTHHKKLIEPKTSNREVPEGVVPKHRLPLYKNDLLKNRLLSHLFEHKSLSYNELVNLVGCFSNIIYRDVNQINERYPDLIQSKKVGRIKKLSLNIDKIQEVLKC